MSLVTVYDSGTGSAMGEANLAITQKGYPRDGSKRGVIFCHAAGYTGIQPLDIANWSNLNTIIQAIAEAGYPIISADLAGQGWANDASLTKLGAAKTYLQGTLGAKAGKVHLVGFSMGGATAMAYAKANPTLVSALCLLLPASDLQDIVTNNRASLAAAVNAAYSGGYSDATYGATHNPTTFASSLAGIPTQTWYCTDDTTIIPATVTDVMTAIGGVDLHAITGNHTNAALANVTVATVLSFLAANEA